MSLFFAAIDLVDEAAAKLKMEITSKPTELDEIDRAVLKLEMEKLSLKNDSDKASKERLSKLEQDLSSLKQKQKELNEQWDREKSFMTRIRSIKEEVVLNYLNLMCVSILYYFLIRPKFERSYCFYVRKWTVIFIGFYFAFGRLIELTLRWKRLKENLI